MKETLYPLIEQVLPELCRLSDTIFDTPEIGYEEHRAQALLCGWLEDHGFAVERGVGQTETAFRAVWEQGTGGPSIGLLCEYDALAGIGHACGHHMQGPAILGAAWALKECGIPTPFKVVVYGTPAEENFSGKIPMLKNGCFQDIDVALMTHGSGETATDVKSMANTKYTVKFHGKSSHAAIKPELGRSALDALLLSFQGLEFLREHVKEDTRIHYTVVSSGGTPANVVPAYAEGSFYVRSYSRAYLNEVNKRFVKVMEGAAHMTETQAEIIEVKSVDNKIPVLSLNELLMENARAAGAPNLQPPREKTGSTDFGNVMHQLPGSCIRVQFVPQGTPSHSETYLNNGKSREAHEAIGHAARILAGTSLDLITCPEKLSMVQEEFARAKAAEERAI